MKTHQPSAAATRASRSIFGSLLLIGLLVLSACNIEVTQSDGTGNGEPLQVVSTVPADAASDVSPTDSITVTFSAAMNCLTLDVTQVTITPQDANLAANISCDGSSVSFAPTTHLQYGTAYSISLGTGISDSQGNALAESYNFAFTTAADTAAPTITIDSPLDNATFQTARTATVTGTVADNDAVTSLSLTINGGAAQSLTLSGGALSQEITLPLSSNIVMVTATDTAGNSGSVSLNLHYLATGLLDTANFNALGYHTFNIANSHDSANGVAIAADGSIYAVGYANNGSNYDMAVWHVGADGTLDTAYGTAGVAILNGAAGGNGHDFLDDIVIDTDGKAVVVGHSRTVGGDYDLVVARFNTDGTLDSTFGGDVNPADGTKDGFLVIDISGAGSTENGAGILIDADGRLYVAATSNAGGDNDMYLFRFTSAGVLDTSFASIGFVHFDSGGADSAEDIAADTDGNLLVVGQANGSMAIWRVTSSGANDSTFNGTGSVTFAGPGGACGGKSVALDANGNIVVVGNMVVTGNVNDMALWRYTSDGSIDTAFGGNYDGDAIPDGYVTHDGAGGNYHDFDYGNDLVIDGAGNILVTGNAMANHGGAVKPDMTVWRFTASGVLDDRFGDDINPADGTPDGFFTQNSAAGGNNLDNGKAIAIDSLGRVLVAGESISVSNGSDMALWRLY